MNKRLKAAIAGLAFVAGCEVGIALQLAKMIRDYALKEKALSEPLEVSEEEIAAEQAINEELDTAADTEEICEEDTSVEDQNTVTPGPQNRWSVLQHCSLCDHSRRERFRR